MKLSTLRAYRYLYAPLNICVFIGLSRSAAEVAPLSLSPSTNLYVRGCTNVFVSVVAPAEATQKAPAHRVGGRILLLRSKEALQCTLGSLWIYPDSSRTNRLGPSRALSLALASLNTHTHSSSVSTNAEIKHFALGLV